MRAFTLSIITFVTLVISAIADDACSGPHTRTQPPDGAFVVDASGKHSGSVRTISAAVARLTHTEKDQTIFVLPGVYREQVVLPELSGPLVLQGYTCNTMSYDANQVTITQSKAQRDLPSEITSGRNELTATLLVESDNVKLYNLNVANTANHTRKNGQAVALSVDGNNCGVYGSQIMGYQDTVFANKGRELFARSLISGAIDFIFGAYALLWCESCDIKTIGAGSITANGRDGASSPSFYVFNKARVSGSNGKGSTFLGRPWRKFARVVWQNSELGDVINPLGWQKWNNDPDTDNVFFGEFNNTGPGAVPGQRASFSKQLTTQVPITQILGDNYRNEWFVDTTYL
ncbi:hypothetical protein PsorP6_003191 [Peronosclerospora sorghi]|uniref:Uncharacterized protein n=1 Tax=Peronosclerospora sorghi TaxID=230839 RepID=A0ACC0VM72_9STRA|nr:hypothetical protein PsorP6_003191 [Peronosclerospora sorghi]